VTFLDISFFICGQKNMPSDANTRDATDAQAALDLAFADLEHLLARRDTVVAQHGRQCINGDCAGSDFSFLGPADGYPGARVCDACGCVQEGVVFFETMYGNRTPTKSSNYRRLHHWHERISQFLLLESPIADDEMLQIGSRLLDGSYDCIGKEAVREVLRSLKLQRHIERWLQILHRVTGVQPPCPGPLILQQLDALFEDLQRPFEATRDRSRKNFLNYNYTFQRLFDKLGCRQFGMFFPMIKSKAKLRTLDETYARMARSAGWEVTELKPVPPFVVRLHEPDALLLRLKAQVAASARAAPGRAKSLVVSRTFRRPLSTLGPRRTTPYRLRRSALTASARQYYATRRR
jgi:hypothetical protein